MGAVGSFGKCLSSLKSYISLHTNLKFGTRESYWFLQDHREDPRGYLQNQLQISSTNVPNHLSRPWYLLRA